MIYSLRGVTQCNLGVIQGFFRLIFNWVSFTTCTHRQPEVHSTFGSYDADPKGKKTQSCLQQGHLNLPRATRKMQGLGERSPKAREKWAPPFNEGRIFFLTNGIGKAGYSHAKGMKLDPYIISNKKK